VQTDSWLLSSVLQLVEVDLVIPERHRISRSLERSRPRRSRGVLSTALGSPLLQPDLFLLGADLATLLKLLQLRRGEFLLFLLLDILGDAALQSGLGAAAGILSLRALPLLRLEKADDDGIELIRANAREDVVRDGVRVLPATPAGGLGSLLADVLALLSASGAVGAGLLLLGSFAAIEGSLRTGDEGGDGLSVHCNGFGAWLKIGDVFVAIK
jgi:hypothetical protein